MNEDEEYDDLAGIFDDEELPEEYYDVQVSDIEVWVGRGGEGVPLGQSRMTVVVSEHLRVTSLVLCKIKVTDFLS